MGMPSSPPGELSSSIIKAVKEEDQPLHSVKEENVDALLGASTSPSVDHSTKNEDASFTEEATKEVEEQLYEDRLKVEEEEKEVWRDEAARPASDPMTRFNKFDELLTQTKLYTEFILEKVFERSSNYTSGYDTTLTEEEMWQKEQAELVPLVTGAKLKPYHIEGVKWLISLWYNGLNGILADEMRLGKTTQIVGFLAHLKGHGLHGPYMIIAPATTLTYWVDEISRFDVTGERGDEKLEETIINRRALFVSKLHAILDPFLLRQTKKHIKNTPPGTKGAMCCNTKADKDAVNLLKDHIIIDGARSGGRSSQEEATEVANENGGEGSPNLPSTQPGLEVNVKRRRTDDALLSVLGDIKSTIQASFRSAEPVQVPKSTSPREILEALKQIPDLTHADFLRAYSSLIRDDRQFESLMVLPVDMRKDWLLMETGKK